jgi:hypothetical protein
MDFATAVTAAVMIAGVVNANSNKGPDPVATAATAAVIATGQGDTHWIPSVSAAQDPITQARVRYAQQQRIEYLTSDKGRAYWREQVEIQRLRIPGEFRSTK